MRSSIGLTSSLVLPALVALGCAHTSPPVREPPAQSQLDAAQQESEHAYDRARQAQQQATDKAQQAAAAEQDALRKQGEAARAEERARVLRQQAEQAQREAMREGQQAAEQAQQAQQRALSAEPRAQAQAGAMGAANASEGTVQRISRDEVVIARDNAPPLHVRIDPGQTAVLQDGQPAHVQDLREGQAVTVTYKLDRDQPVAQTIETHGQTANE